MRAKTMVRIVASLVLGGSLLSVVTFLASFGASAIVPQVVRFGLTLLICYYLVQGRQWARWLTVVLCVVAVVTAFSTPPPSGAGGGPTLVRILGAVYLVCLVILLVPPAIWTFFASGGAGATGSSRDAGGGSGDAGVPH